MSIRWLGRPRLLIMSLEPTPQRIADADRDRAVDALRTHFEAGRLDDAEFAERMSAALDARFATDLTALFVDLPEPRPAPAASAGVSGFAGLAVPAASSSVPARASDKADALGLARKLVWPVALVLWLTTGSFQWIVVAIVASIVLGHFTKPRREPPPPLQR